MAAPTTAAELEAEIEATRRQVEAEKTRRRELEAETAQAAKRQKLRVQLEKARLRLAAEQAENAREAERRRSFDTDRPWWRYSGVGAPTHLPESKRVMRASSGQSTDCAFDVARGEFVWRITGFSWLKGMLEQDNEDRVVRSLPFPLGDEKFVFHYNPWALEHQRVHGSLAIVLQTEERITLRYRIYVKARSGEFVQWGETRDVVHQGDDEEWGAYGPDAHLPDHPASSLGIFGLSHEELLRSEWVQNDTLTVKFELEVRPDMYANKKMFSLAAEIPESTIVRDTQALFEEGTCSDVRFMVEGEEIEAHSQILSARSEVFRKQLTAGMQESISKVIKIEDCDVPTFQAFLQFLYTDRLPDVQDLLPKGTSSESGNASGSPQLSQIQALMAVSHKYQVKRLQIWCEVKLSEQIDTPHVCSMLRQAHLLQAKQLEQACLGFIRERAAQVLTLPTYIEMVKKWPQIGVKVSLFSAGVAENAALAAIDAMETPQGQQSEQAAN